MGDIVPSLTLLCSYILEEGICVDLEWEYNTSESIAQF